jgi:hypothetical protein
LNTRAIIKSKTCEASNTDVGAGALIAVLDIA